MIARSHVVTKRLLFLATMLVGLIGPSTELWGQTGGGFAYVANCGAGPFCGGTGSGDV